MITLSSHLSSLFTYLYYCCFVMRVTLCQKWTETLGALMYREPHLKPKGNILCKRYRRYLPKHMPIFSFHEAQVTFEPWTCVIPNKAPGWATRRVTTRTLPAFFTCLQHCCRVHVASSIHMGKFSIGSRTFFTLQEKSHPKCKCQTQFLSVSLALYLRYCATCSTAKSRTVSFPKGMKFQRKKILTTRILQAY